MELYLIRHGESMGDIEQRVEGSWDAELTDNGREQVKLLQKRLAVEDSNFDLIFSSPLKRAAETAKAISEIALKPVIYDERLKEQDTGILGGMKIEEASAINKPRDENGYRYYEKFPEGESALDHTWRVAHFYMELLDRYSDKKICLITHGGTINILIRLIYGLPINRPYKGKEIHKFSMGDTAISKFKINGPQDVLTYFINDLNHIKAK